MNMPILTCLLCIFYCIWPHIALSQVVYTETKEYCILENDYISLSIFKTSGDIASFSDKLTGHDLFEKPASESALYKIMAIDDLGQEIFFTNKDVKNIRFCPKKESGQVELGMKFQGHAGKDIDITVRVELEKDSSMTNWKAEVRNGTSLAINALYLPIINIPKKLGKTSADDNLVLPMLDGLILTDLHTEGLRPSVDLSYPGRASVQFMAFYDKAIGIYLASYDSNGNPKSFGYELNNRTVNLFIQNRFPEEKGKDISLEYETILGFFHSKIKNRPVTWYDAADVYRQWAERQPWCRKRIYERQDIPSWFKQGPPIVHYPILRKEGGKSILHTANLIKQYSDYLGLSLLARPTGWEKHGTWIGPDTFPPYGQGQFKKSLENIKNDGNYCFLYLEGYQWMLHDRRQGYDGWKFFHKYCANCATKYRNGRARIKGNSRAYVEACRTTDVAQETLFENAMKCVEIGADAIQIEVVGGGGVPCYNKTHPHPPGYGKWIYERFAELLDRVRTEGKKRNPDLVVTMEEPGELYINHLQGYNGRNYRELRWPRGLPHSKGIPLFTYIYHQYALGFSGYHRGFLAKGKQAYQYRDIAANLVCGTLNGVDIYKNKYDWGIIRHNRKAKGFLKETCLAISSYAKDFLLLGRMLRPAKIKCADYSFDYPNVRDMKKTGGIKWTKWTEPQILHSVWQSPAGHIGYLFVNYTDKKADFEVELKSCGILKGKCYVSSYKNGVKKMISKRISLPQKLSLSLGPLKVMLVEVKPALSDDVK